MKTWLAELRRSFLAVAVLAVILCGLYPLTAWFLAQGLFPGRANGSLIVRDGVVVGSSLIGQQFSSPKYFHPRPSAAGAGIRWRPVRGDESRALIEGPRGDRPQADRRIPGGKRACRRDSGAGRRRHGLGERARPPYLPGKRPDPGLPRIEGPGPRGGRCPCPDRGLYRRPHAGHPGRSPGERPTSEPRSRRSPRCRKIGPTRFSG